DRAHHLSGRAEAALRSEFINKRLLYGMQRSVAGLQALDGYDTACLDAVREGRTGIMSNIVDQERAGTAFAAVAADLCARQSQLVTQRVGERFLRQHIDAPGPAVDVERDQALDGALALFTVRPLERDGRGRGDA